MLVIDDPRPGSSELGYVRVALEQGELVVVPTDTVYGLAALATDEAACRRMYEVKGRDLSQPTAVIWPSVVRLRESLADISIRAMWAIAALMPGPWTLIVDNPAGHMPWLTGGTVGPIGVRVPAGALDLPPIAATSANLSGDPVAPTGRQIDLALAAHVACVVDRGPIRGGVESTILDLTAWERGGDVRIVRDPSHRAGAALAVLGSAPGA